MNHVLERVEAVAEQLSSRAVAADEAGRVPEDTADLLRKTGVVRQLQPKSHGGYESTMAEFVETGLRVSSLNPAAGWIGGVVGVHPWEIALMDPRVQDEVWGEDADTWMASPYAPTGLAVPTDGGYTFTGRWQFSSGTDNCDWIVLGGIVTDKDGNVGQIPDVRHFVLPRADYEIVEGSWEVIGLKGTGSKDIVINGAFVPEYRVTSAAELMSGKLAAERRPGNPLYALPFGTVFSYAIATATIGMTEGALAAFMNYTRNRITVTGSRSASQPQQLSALGAAAADVDASRTQLLAGANRMFDITSSGRLVTPEERLELRRNQVRASRRAVDAIDKLFVYAGGGALRLQHDFQRFWRDSHAGMNHICNVEDTVYEAYGHNAFGDAYDPGLFY